MMDGKQHIQQAYKCILDHDYEQAISSFEQAVADEPGNAFFHYSLSITYARSNKLNKAIIHAQVAVSLDPDAENYKLHLATLQARLLLVEAERIMHDNPADPEAMKLLGRAVCLDPLSIEAKVMLALSYGQRQQYEEAECILREAIKLNPEHHEAGQLLREYVNRSD